MGQDDRWFVYSSRNAGGTDMLDEKGVVGQWIKVFSGDRDACVRAATELALIGFRHRERGAAARGDLETVAASMFPEVSFSEFLETALSDPREEVQCEAALAVGELAGGEEMVDLLVKHIEQPELSADAKLRATITRALGNLGGPTAVKYLKSHPDQVDCVRSLARLQAAHKARYPNYSQEFDKPVVRGESRLPLVTEIRGWFEKISNQHENEYVGFLAKQVL
jgi:HEAT repeat protein